MSKIDILFFEKSLIKLLFEDKEVREKVLPFLEENIFDQIETRKIIKNINDYVEEYSRFPSVDDIKLSFTSAEDNDTYKVFCDILQIDLNTLNKDNLLKEIEDFFKKKLIFHEISEAVENIKDDELGKIADLPDKLRDSISFSFKTDIGIDLFEAEDELFNYLHNKDLVIPTGIRYFDDMIEGGFHEKSISLFLSETRRGKSLIQCGLSVNCILNNKNVLYVTFEISKQKISQRILANIMGVNINDLKFLSKENFHLHYEKIKKQANRKLIIREYPTMSSNANMIRGLLKELKNKIGFIPDIIFLDYIGIMLPNRINKTDNSYHTLKRICQEVRGLSMETGIPIVSAVQTNREGFGSSSLDLTDIADSIGITTEADLIIAVTQSQEQIDLGVYSWSILKNRFGVDGLRCTVGVDKYHMKIFPIEQERRETTQTTEQKVQEAGKEIINNIKNEKKEAQKRIINFE